MSTIESVFAERRVFPPSAEFVKQANVSGRAAYDALYAEAERDYSGFWGRLAKEHVLWQKPFSQVLDESGAIEPWRTLTIVSRLELRPISCESMSKNTPLFCESVNL